jgi:branched-chain amino acid transport system permease protein
VDWLDFFQSITDGLLFGSIYALIGIGFTLIFGVMHKINLAYGAASIAGAYVSIAVAAYVPLPALVTFLIAAIASGGLAGAMIGASVGVLSPLLVVPITVKGLIVCVIGGLGSIPGAIIAGLAVGAFENFFLAFRGVTERDMYVMLLLFVFLVFRPGGIFSRSVARD